MSKHVPYVCGDLRTATGVHLRVEHVKRRSWRISDVLTGATSYAGSEAKAWGSARYQAQINHKTNRSDDYEGEL